MAIRWSRKQPSENLMLLLGKLALTLPRHSIYLYSNNIQPLHYNRGRWELGWVPFSDWLSVQPVWEEPLRWNHFSSYHQQLLHNLKGEKCMLFSLYPWIVTSVIRTKLLALVESCISQLYSHKIMSQRDAFSEEHVNAIWTGRIRQLFTSLASKLSYGVQMYTIWGDANSACAQERHAADVGAPTRPNRSACLHVCTKKASWKFQVILTV